jgi:hypothetical protein
MTSPQFRTKAGRLTPYAFACGYIEQISTPTKQLKLERDGCYHVKSYNFAEHTRLCWECFDTLTEARSYYDKQKSLLTN